MNNNLLWKEILKDEFEKEYFKKLKDFVDNEYQINTIFPPYNRIFSAFRLCSFNDLKVVIIGQDPYHGIGQANGLCFSVNDNVPFPPSLYNIFLEIKNDINLDIPASGNLEKWAKQGVFLLNTVLTVQKSIPNSHKDKGWEIFTDNVIRCISEKKENVVFILWGNFARNKKNLIDKNKHLILESGHPSPFSANKGFWFGNRHFSKTNKYLEEKGINKIDWDLRN